MLHRTTQDINTQHINNNQHPAIGLYHHHTNHILIAHHSKRSSRRHQSIKPTVGPEISTREGEEAYNSSRHENKNNDVVVGANDDDEKQY